MLLGAGANVHTTNKLGNTPLMDARRHDRSAVFALLQGLFLSPLQEHTWTKLKTTLALAS